MTYYLPINLHIVLQYTIYIFNLNSYINIQFKKKHSSRNILNTNAILHTIGILKKLIGI